MGANIILFPLFLFHIFWEQQKINYIRNRNLKSVEMSAFTIYTYQFTPIQNRQLNLLEEYVSDEELMERKQELFHAIFDSQTTVFKSGNKLLAHKIIFNEGGMIIFRIANDKKMNLEERFQKKTYEYAPSCLVLIDNRHGIQRIAIQEDKKAFSQTGVVKNILQKNFQKFMAEAGLSINIQKEYDKNEFWTIVNNHKDEVTMVRFFISYPNLPRLNKKMKEMLSNASAKTNSKQTTVEYKAAEGEYLNLSTEDEDLKDLVNASADGGDKVTIKVKRYKAFISTGETSKTVEIEDFETSIPEDLFTVSQEKVIEIFNKIFK